MQLFGLHSCPAEAASAMCNAHIVKMSVETLQILYTALRANGCAWIDKLITVPKSITLKRKRSAATDDVTNDVTKDICDSVPTDSDSDSSYLIEYEHVKPYRSTHAKHPCMLWTAACDAHFEWVLAHGIALVHQYETRYGKRGLCYYHITHIRDNWQQHGWASPRSIPSTITPQVWLNSLDTSLRDDNTTRVACLHPPDGCIFGVVCMDPEHRLVTDTTADDSDNSDTIADDSDNSDNSDNFDKLGLAALVDWTGSYHKFYQYKRDVAFKRPMSWRSVSWAK